MELVSAVKHPLWKKKINTSDQIGGAFIARQYCLWAWYIPLLLSHSLSLSVLMPCHSSWSLPVSTASGICSCLSSHLNDSRWKRHGGPKPITLSLSHTALTCFHSFIFCPFLKEKWMVIEKDLKQDLWSCRQHDSPLSLYVFTNKVLTFKAQWQHC